MIFTIGYGPSYEENFRKSKVKGVKVLKLGKYTNYPGGSVFRTRQDAEDYIASNEMEDYKVYGVRADWNEHTSHREGMPFNDLLVNRELVQLPKKVT